VGVGHVSHLSNIQIVYDDFAFFANHVGAYDYAPFCRQISHFATPQNANINAISKYNRRRATTLGCPNGGVIIRPYKKTKSVLFWKFLNSGNFGSDNRNKNVNFSKL